MEPRQGFSFHPIANIFPLLAGDELEALAADIREHGLRDPVVLFEGKILDGRNRATACILAGKTLTTTEFPGTRQEALAFVWSENFHRRHLDSGQAAVAMAKRAKLDAEFRAAVVEPLRQGAKGRKAQAKGKRRGKKASVTQQIGEESKRHDAETSAALAKAAGTNRRYLEAACDLLETHPERLEAVEKGDKKLSQVLREVKREATQAKLAALPTEKYRVIYADPPWSYGNSGGGIDQYGPAERHYPTMTIAELCALDIKSIVEPDAVLFLWVTSPQLAECWPVIKAWGFEYKTSFVWDKVKHNFGHYNSVRHEFLLVCTRGSCTPDTKKLHDSVVAIERSAKHSEKPEEFRRMIDGLYRFGNRVELFSRTEATGWDRWGADA